MVLSWEKRLALEHLGENAPRTPDIYFDIVLLPCEHDLGGSVVSSGNIACHLGILYTSETEIADLEITVLVYEDIARLQVTVDNTSGVHIFQATLLESARVSLLVIATHQDLIEEVLDELLL